MSLCIAFSGNVTDYQKKKKSKREFLSSFLAIETAGFFICAVTVAVH